jgi:mRNA interferase MazF
VFFFAQKFPKEKTNKKLPSKIYSKIHHLVMEKDFESWHLLKAKINENKARYLFREQEVWWCFLGANIGDEQDGKGLAFKRPVIIFKKYSSNLFLAIPLSTKIKDRIFNHIFEFKNIKQCALLSQARIIDAKRLSHKLGKLTANEYKQISEKFKNLLFTKN